MPTEYEIQGWFGAYGWETVTTEDTRPEALRVVQLYRDSDPDHRYRVHKETRAGGVESGD